VVAVADLVVTELAAEVDLVATELAVLAMR
jgi:hypothetical protein